MGGNIDLYRHLQNHKHEIHFTYIKLLADIENFKGKTTREQIEFAKGRTINKRDDILHVPPAWKMGFPTQREQAQQGIQ